MGWPLLEPGMGECPFCEYEGPARSVEAHISGTTDEAHEGRLGRNWRRNIRDPDAVDPTDYSEEEPGEVAESMPTGAAMAVVGATALLVVVVLVDAALLIEEDSPGGAE